MIFNFKQFKEAVSGTELVGNHMGPGYPQQVNKANTLTSTSTDALICNIDDKIYTYDDYQSKYHEYLKIGGTPLNGFNQSNLDHIILKLTEDTEES